MRYENHILAAQITHIHFEKKKKHFSNLAVKITGYVHKNGHSSNSQYLRQSRPVNYVTQRYNET